jgi:hypothetical protein
MDRRELTLVNHQAFCVGLPLPSDDQRLRREYVLVEAKDEGISGNLGSTRR